MHQLLLKLVEQSLGGAEEQDIVNVERQDDEASLVLVDAYARIRLERVEADGDELHVHRAEPVFRALPKTVQALLELHDERNSCFVVSLVGWRHLDEHVLFDVGVEECRLHVQHLHLVVQLRRGCEHHEEVMEPAHGNEGAAAVDARDL